MERQYKYITVLDYLKGQVYLYDYNPKDWDNAEDFVATRHDLDNTHYMVHKYMPALWTKDLYFCNREEAHMLSENKV